MDIQRNTEASSRNVLIFIISLRMKQDFLFNE